MLIAGMSFSCAAPQSRIPTAHDAIERMRATLKCSRGVAGEATLDYFGTQGRVTGSVLYYAMLPEQLRFDVISPFGVTLSTLTSNGQDFALYDLQNKQFLYGPANVCNVSRFTHVPVPPFALAQLLHGEAPVLVHEPEHATIEWESGLLSAGYYSVRIPSKHDAFEEIRLVPKPDDFDKPWQEQRLRVLRVRVEKQGVPLYQASLRDHRPIGTKPALQDPDGLGPALPPSGPQCNAEAPGALRIEVPTTGQDVVFKNREQWHNPPLPPKVFTQQCSGGVACRYSSCSSTP
jgi:hypothetical protein